MFSGQGLGTLNLSSVSGIVARAGRTMASRHRRFIYCTVEAAPHQWMHLDLVILTESHWQSDLEWQDPVWTCAHFAPNTKSHAGIVVMINKKLCQSSDISSVHINPGRLAHVRIHAAPRPIGVIAVYQYAGTATSTVLRNRHTLWTDLDIIHTSPASS